MLVERRVCITTIKLILHFVDLLQRLVHLATLREEALSQLQQLDSVKVSLTERKIIQQGRLIAALDARLAAAHAVVDPHRTAVHNHVRALEKAAAYYSNVLQGTSDQPSDAEWADVTEQYKQLQQQQEQHQQQAVCAHLSGSLASSLQPCSVSYKHEAWPTWSEVGNRHRAFYFVCGLAVTASVYVPCTPCSRTQEVPHHAIGLDAGSCLQICQPFCMILCRCHK